MAKTIRLDRSVSVLASAEVRRDDVFEHAGRGGDQPPVGTILIVALSNLREEFARRAIKKTNIDNQKPESKLGRVAQGDSK